MKIKTINWFLILFAIVSIPFLYNISENSGLLQGKLLNSGINRMFQKTPSVVYDLNIPLKNHMITRMKTYEAQGIKSNSKALELYRKVLNINSPIKETSSEFKIENEEKQVIVSKDKGIIQYKNFINKNKRVNHKISGEKAVKEVLDFTKSLSLSCNHEKSLVEDISEQNIYQVRFVNTLEGILNYSYCTKADVSYEGDILNLECHQLIYYPKQIVSIKPIKEAYEELIRIPVDGENIQIDIQKAELVYFTKSEDQSSTKQFIVEPTYRFFGETNKGSTFEYFISAVDK